VQPFVDTAVGKFLFKYQKWGFQQTRNFMRNVIQPALGKNGPRDLAPLARYLVMTAALGAGLAALKEWLFGVPDRSASFDEIGRTWNEDQVRGAVLGAQKLWNAQVAAGAYGMLSNYAQVATDVAERSKFKNPLEPPGTAIVTNAGEVFLRAVEQKTLTPGDVDDFLRAQIGLYRTGKQVLARTGTPGMDNERARQELSWLGVRTRRFADEVGVESSRTSLGRVGKTETSPGKAALLKALRTGDVGGAREAIDGLVDGLDGEEKAAMMKSLKATVRASQPVRVGTAGEERRQLFLAWAQRRLPAEELARIKAIDAKYRATASRVGLFGN
jgi:hypothetical protein